MTDKLNRVAEWRTIRLAAHKEYEEGIVAELERKRDLRNEAAAQEVLESSKTSDPAELKRIHREKKEKTEAIGVESDARIHALKTKRDGDIEGVDEEKRARKREAFRAIAESNRMMEELIRDGFKPEDIEERRKAAEDRRAARRSNLNATLLPQLIGE